MTGGAATASEPGWRAYQEEVAAYFSELGLQAETDMRMAGARADHDVDVVVRADLAGISILWLVECKHWKRRVTKAAVLTHQTIVADVGADRGIMMSEAGYQSGAINAARNTSTELTSLAGLRAVAEPYLQRVTLDSLQRRHDRCNERISRYSRRLPGGGRSGWTLVHLRGAGDVLALYAQLSALDHGLEAARTRRVPAAYAFEIPTDTRLVARTTGPIQS